MAGTQNWYRYVRELCGLAFIGCERARVSLLWRCDAVAEWPNNRGRVGGNSRGNGHPTH